MSLWPFDRKSPQLIKSNKIFPFPWLTLSSPPKIGEFIVVYFPQLTIPAVPLMIFLGYFLQCLDCYSRSGRSTFAIVVFITSSYVNREFDGRRLSPRGDALYLFFRDDLIGVYVKDPSVRAVVAILECDSRSRFHHTGSRILYSYSTIYKVLKFSLFKCHFCEI